MVGRIEAGLWLFRTRTGDLGFIAPLPTSLAIKYGDEHFDDEAIIEDGL